MNAPEPSFTNIQVCSMDCRRGRKCVSLLPRTPPTPVAAATSFLTKTRSRCWKEARRSPLSQPDRLLQKSAELQVVTSAIIKASLPGPIMCF